LPLCSTFLLPPFARCIFCPRTHDAIRANGWGSTGLWGEREEGGGGGGDEKGGGEGLEQNAVFIFPAAAAAAAACCCLPGES
jgi:hypothetical protein